MKSYNLRSGLPVSQSDTEKYVLGQPAAWLAYQDERQGRDKREKIGNSTPRRRSRWRRRCWRCWRCWRWGLQLGERETLCVCLEPGWTDDSHHNTSRYVTDTCLGLPGARPSLESWSNYCSVLTSPHLLTFTLHSGLPPGCQSSPRKYHQTRPAAPAQPPLPTWLHPEDLEKIPDHSEGNQDIFCLGGLTRGVRCSKVSSISPFLCKYVIAN